MKHKLYVYVCPLKTTWKVNKPQVVNKHLENMRCGASQKRGNIIYSYMDFNGLLLVCLYCEILNNFDSSCKQFL